MASIECKEKFSFTVSTGIELTRLSGISRNTGMSLSVEPDSSSDRKQEVTVICNRYMNGVACYGVCAFAYLSKTGFLPPGTMHPNCKLEPQGHSSVVNFHV